MCGDNEMAAQPGLRMEPDCSQEVSLERRNGRGLRSTFHLPLLCLNFLGVLYSHG